MLFDGFMSMLPEFGGMATNLLTQIISGIPSNDSAFWIFIDHMSADVAKKDYKAVGGDVTLLLSSLVKIEAPEFDLDVEPV